MSLVPPALTWEGGACGGFTVVSVSGVVWVRGVLCPDCLWSFSVSLGSEARSSPVSSLSEEGLAGDEWSRSCGGLAFLVFFCFSCEG